MAQSSAFFSTTVSGKTVPSGLTKVLVWGLPGLLLGTMLFLFYATYSWISEATETSGTVIAIEQVFQDRNADSALEDMYLPRFSYDRDGKQAEALLSMAGDQFNFDIGSTRQILYHPQSDTNVRLADITYNYALPMMLGYLLFISLLLALVMWFWIKAIGRRRNTEGMS